MKVHVDRISGSDAARVAECQQADEIEGLRREMGHVNKTLFLGNGQAPLVTQTATNTQAIGALTRLAWVTLTAVVGEAVLLVFRLFTGGGTSGAQERLLAELASGVQELNRAVAVREFKKGGQQ
ncbi:MAG: hypothetical protein PHN34_10985 [Kiritimatiellae bacterium]|nr:hypothetical protein [Kiritimatiellia bacterium]